MVEVVLGLLVWLFMKQHASSREEQWPDWMWWAGVGLLFVARFFVFFHSQAPFGYDTGIYRYEFLASFKALPGYVSHVFLGLPLLTNVFQLFGVSVDSLVGGFYGLVGLLLPLSMAFYAEKVWGRKVAFLVLFFCAVSLVQWKAFSMLLFKQELALVFGFFALWLFSRQSFWLLLVLFFMALLQPLEAFLLAVCLALATVFFLPRLSVPRILSFGLLGLVALGVLFWLDPDFWAGAWRLFSEGILDPGSLEMSLRSGIFLSLADYGYQSALFFVLGALGVALSWKDPKAFVLKTYALVLFGWIAFGFFFYERLLVSFDAVCLLFAALAFCKFLEALMSDRFGKSFAVLLLLGISFPFGAAAFRYQPLIDSQELHSIRQFCASLPSQAYVAATDSFYGPWLRGYCPEQRVFGPGLFEHNRWSRAEWEAFWDGDAELLPELFSRYESVVYFYRGEKQYQLEFDAGSFTWVEGGWWKGGKGL